MFGPSAAHSASAANAWEDLAEPIFERPLSNPALLNTVVLSIAQDHENFLWIGTEEGVGRWDGYRYRLYHADQGANGGLPDNYIQTLYVDAQGTLWIGTLSAGVSRYDPHTDRFVTLRDGLSSVAVNQIADDGTGGVWVATNRGLDRVTARDGVIGHLRHDPRDPTGLADDNVRAVLRDRAGRLWIGNLGAVYRQDIDGGRLTRIGLPAAAGAVHSLEEGPDGTMWIGAKSGAYTVRAGSMGSTAIPELIPGTEGTQILSIAPGRSQEMWLGTYGRGVIVVNAITHASRRIRHDPLIAESLPEDTLWALFRDAEGSLWQGTSRGISRHNPHQVAVLSVSGLGSRSSTLSDQDVEAVLPRPDGRLWLGLGAKGVDVVDPVKGRVGSMRRGSQLQGESRDLSEVRGLISMDRGDVFLCTRTGLYRKRPGDPRPIGVPLPQGVEVHTAAIDASAERLWIGTKEHGLWTLRLRGSARAQPWRASKDLTDLRISVIKADPSGGLWVGTLNGLNHVDPSTGSVERIGVDPTSPWSLSAPNVGSLLIDRRGWLWVGTMGGGISVLEDPHKERVRHFRHLGLSEGLPNLNVDQMLESNAGMLWAATDGGLAVVNPDGFRVQSLGLADGVAISSYWVSSGARIRDGVLAFGGAGGLTLVRPERYTPYNIQPPLVVTDVRTGDHALPWGAFNGVDGEGSIRVDPRANSFEVQFAALDFSASERIRYAYRLEGYEQSWIEADSDRRVASYTNLPPGHYTLQLRSTDRYGSWIERIVPVPIDVPPLWYQTSWCKVAGFLGALGAGALLLRSRTAFLNARRRDLERQVSKQTAQLRERERQLEQLAYRDPLTGLPNRRMLTRTFDEITAGIRPAVTFALLLIDLDHFKVINDSLGHDAGDALLVEIARRLRHAVGDSEHVFRLGGDEFAILILGGLSKSMIETICNRILQDVFAIVHFNGFEMISSPSIGIARFPLDGRSMDQLLKIADVALYQAKDQGRNTWRWGGPLYQQNAAELSELA